MSQAASAIVTGRVQGVGFRWATREAARRENLRGWVRNERDGSVLVYAEGDEKALEAFRLFLHSGPPGAAVQKVVWEEVPARHELNEFVIQR